MKGKKTCEQHGLFLLAPWEVQQLRSVHQLQINPIETTGETLYSDQKGEWDSTNLRCSSSPTRAGSSSGNGITQKVIGERVCKYWLHGNCVEADKCQYLHSWFKGHGVFKLAELNGHIKAISGIALPSGSEKLYTASRDGYIRVWDCHTGQCDGVVNLGGEIGSLISAGPWVFAGIKDVVKAWNIESCADLSLDGPVGQIYAMVVNNDMLFAGAQNGTIHAWKANKETNAFEPATTLEGHNGAVVSLTVGGGGYILAWGLDTLQCIHTLKEHASVVMSLVCWGPYLISCSLDQTIKVWFATEAGNLEVTYTHNEEHGVLSLFGMNNSEGKPILCALAMTILCGFMNYHRQIFAKEEVREIQIGPGGLVFTGDGTGQVDVGNAGRANFIDI
ncbi:Zinc finger CCCH domain-containing protein 48 [Vitis vinifera]|uniref:Zinc finger CCCH domain-containing protein 48 n=1 Tax=Vitis vinifera TaxID=29760 RepID=A0A438EUU8_VITVI|nr:Zinc finger CCCH domain-containing protein 48 [Vitis vinifera]